MTTQQRNGSFCYAIFVWRQERCHWFWPFVSDVWRNNWLVLSPRRKLLFIGGSPTGPNASRFTAENNENGKEGSRIIESFVFQRQAFGLARQIIWANEEKWRCLLVLLAPNWFFRSVAISFWPRSHHLNNGNGVRHFCHSRTRGWNGRLKMEWAYQRTRSRDGFKLRILKKVTKKIMWVR